ncbi:MAG: SpoIIIAC/SpoIIIAD family protein [Clostridiales bacterium]|nr:SpoIIIAC/SpoIIIAD family protein [Clostridiales bacterium]
MDFLIKGSIIGIIASVIGLMLKKNVPEFALLLTVSAAVTILYFAFDVLGDVKDFVYEVAENGAISSALLSPVLKCAGISICAKLASDVCKDAGYAASASAVELVASAAALYAALPLMRTVLKMTESFL